jgi:hypothetical protein
MLTAGFCGGGALLPPPHPAKPAIANTATHTPQGTTAFVIFDLIKKSVNVDLE